MTEPGPSGTGGLRAVRTDTGPAAGDDAVTARQVVRPSPLPTVGRVRRAVAVFARLHVAPVLARPRASLLAMAGLGVAATVMVAMLVLSAAVVDPFRSLTDVMRPHAQLQVRPTVQDRLPESLVARLGSTPDVTAAIGWLGGLRTARSERAETGVMVVGAGCDLTDRIGVAPCPEHAAAVPGAAAAPSSAAPASENTSGPGRSGGVWLSPRAADALGVRPGDPIGLSGGVVGDAYVAGILSVPPGSAATRLNAGSLALMRLADAQTLLGAGAHVSSVFLATDRPAEVGRHVAAFSPNATVGPLTTVVRPFLQLHAVLIVLTGLLVVAGGSMIAGGSFALALDARRRALSVAITLGRSVRSTAAGLLAESSILGLIAGVLCAPLAFALGGLFVRAFATPLLAGSGAVLSTPWSPVWIGVAAVVGAGCGLVAAIPVVSRVVRRRASDLGADDDLPVHRAQVWPVPFAGLCMLGVPLGWLWGSGRVPAWLGYLGFALTVSGVILLGFGLAPRVLRRMRWAAGTSAPRLLAYADLLRDPLRYASAVAVVAVAIVAIVGARTLRQMTVAQMADDVRRELDGIVVSGPRTAGDQIDARLTDASVARLAALPGVQSVSPQTLTVISLDGRPVDIIGTDPARPRRNLDILDADPNEAWREVAAGGVIVGDVMANRLGLHAQSLLTLPTTAGKVTFRVAARAQFHFGQDNGVGDLVVASTAQTRQLWQAAPDGVLAWPADGVSTAQLAHTFRTSSGIVGINAADADEADAYAELAGSRFLAPIEWVGVALCLLAAFAVANFLYAALLTRRRTRAALRFVGYRVADERRSLLWEAVAIAVTGAVTGFVAALAASAYLATASPAFLASQVRFRMYPDVLAVVGVAIVLIVTIAFIPAGIRAGRGEVSSVLSEDG